MSPVHEQHFERRILPGMDVCDKYGDKVGSVARIHRVGEHSDATEAAPQDVLEVKTGLFGLGKHLYVPLHDIQEVLNESLFLSRGKEELKTLGYYDKLSPVL